MTLDNDAQYFLELQISTGWGRMLASFSRWCAPQPGQTTLDVGCGPGLLSTLFNQAGAGAFGIDHDLEMLQTSLYSEIANARAGRLPFAAHTFDLVTASNLLYLNAQPLQLLADMVRVLRPGGRVCLLNPSEKMTLKAAEQLADERRLEGLARETLLNYGQRAENNFRWSHDEIADIFQGLNLTDFQTTLRMGPGLVRYARAYKP